MNENEERAVIEDEPPMCGVEHPFNGHFCSLVEGHPAGHVCDYKPTARRSSLEAAEKAHTPSTPTNDEREAQGWREAEAYADDHEPSKRMETADDFMAGWRTADRLRRTSVPEPSAVGCSYVGAGGWVGEPPREIVSEKVVAGAEEPSAECPKCGRLHGRMAVLRAASAVTTDQGEGSR